MIDTSISAPSRNERVASMSTAFAMTIATGFLLALMVFRDHDIGGEIWGPVAGATALVAGNHTVALQR
ncbi:MAG: hypothetical protein AB1Z66_07255 [Candidatus Limnocylindrales bacterium]